MTKEQIYKILLPELLSIQRRSFCWFLQHGLIQEIESFPLLKDSGRNVEISLSKKIL